MKFRRCPFINKVPYIMDYSPTLNKWKKVLNFKRKPLDNENFIGLPCGKCLYCMNKKSTQYAVRCMLELKHHKKSCFITLTYSDDHLPKDGNLNPRDFDLFVKRLRKRIQPVRIRYFAAGEYGSKGERPHYHMIIFGWQPDDLVELMKDKDDQLYNSKFLLNVWGKGFVSVGTVLDLRTIRYTAKYLQKFNGSEWKRVQPFTRMSNRPGLGYKSFSLDFYKDDCIYLEGHKYSIPYYFDVLAERKGYDLLKVKSNREYTAKLFDVPDEIRLLDEYKYFQYCMINKLGYSHIYSITPRTAKSIRDHYFNDPIGFAKHIEFWESELKQKYLEYYESLQKSVQ